MPPVHYLPCRVRSSRDDDWLRIGSLHVRSVNHGDIKQLYMHSVLPMACCVLCTVLSVAAAIVDVNMFVYLNATPLPHPPPFYPTLFLLHCVGSPNNARDLGKSVTHYAGSTSQIRRVQSSCTEVISVFTQQVRLLRPPPDIFFRLAIQMYGTTLGPPQSPPKALKLAGLNRVLPSHGSKLDVSHACAATHIPLQDKWLVRKWF